MLALSCSSSDSSSSGCGSSSNPRCEIDPAATVGGDRITVQCFDGETPEEETRCEKALEQDDEAIYCCVSAVAADAEADAGGGGG